MTKLLPTTKLLPIFTHNMRLYSNAYREVGFKHRQLAEYAYMSASAWCDYASGKTPNPRLWTAVRIAEALRVDLFELTTDKDAVRRNCVSEIKDGGRR